MRASLHQISSLCPSFISLSLSYIPWAQNSIFISFKVAPRPILKSATMSSEANITKWVYEHKLIRILALIILLHREEGGSLEGAVEKLPKCHVTSFLLTSYSWSHPLSIIIMSKTCHSLGKVTQWSPYLNFEQSILLRMKKPFGLFPVYISLTALHAKLVTCIIHSIVFLSTAIPLPTHLNAHY